MSINKAEAEFLSRPGSNPFEILSNYPEVNTVENIPINEQDTPRLARGETVGTVVEFKDNTRRQGVSIALSPFTWSQPLSPFNGTYPFNNVYQTRGGHVQEFDDSQGSERYHRFHPSGTFVEIDSEGNEVRKIVGEGYTIIEKNGNVYIGGSCNITVAGACNILVQNECNLEVNGALNAVVKNDINMITNGCFNLNVKETMKIRADNMVIETSKYNHKNIGQYVIETNTLDSLVKAEQIEQIGTHVCNILNSSTTYTGGDFEVSSSSKIEMKAASDIIFEGSKISAKTDMHLENNLFVKDNVHVSDSAFIQNTTHCPVFEGKAKRSDFADTAGRAPNGAGIPVTPSPTSPTSPDPTTLEVNDILPPQAVVTTGLELPGDRAVVSLPFISISTPNTRASRVAIENDGAGPSSTALYPGYERAPPFVDSSLTNQETLEFTGRAVQPPQGSLSRTPVIVPESLLDRFDSYVMISKYFKLADLSTQAAFPHSVRAQAGLSELDIAINLQYLATNVLDKIVDIYGRDSFVITSGFRPLNNGSQHERGQAVDIQFRNISVDDYPSRAQELVRQIAFDQLLLEYQSGGSGRPWLHISFVKERLRYEFATFYNHRRVSDFTRIA